MRKSLLVAAAQTLFVALGSPAGADTSAIDFESYASGSIDGQDGWSATGAYDYGVVDPSGFGSFAGFGTRSFRISNAITSGSFGDWAFSRSLDDEAGERPPAAMGTRAATDRPTSTRASTSPRRWPEPSSPDSRSPSRPTVGTALG
ncbi:MAG TPA: hypothetical protein VFM81_07345 [Actinomycetota bacterium]|nr:hypothetical protein [Actinomycetota bacterium]